MFQVQYKETSPHFLKPRSLLFGFEGSEEFETINMQTDFSMIYKFYNDCDWDHLVFALSKLMDYAHRYHSIQDKFVNFIYPLLATVLTSNVSEDTTLFFLQILVHAMQIKSDQKNVTNSLSADNYFFNICFSFISKEIPNQAIIFHSLGYIKTFAKINIEYRDYSMKEFPVELIATKYIGSENAELDVSLRQQFFSLITNYTLFPIDEDNAKIIFDLSIAKLSSNEKSDSIFWENALWSIYHIITNNSEIHLKILQINYFPDMIYFFTCSENAEIVFPSLHILRFLFFHDIELPVEYFQNFLALLFFCDQKVSNYAFDCLKVLILRYLNSYQYLIKGKFFLKLEEVLMTAPFSVRMKAAEIACILLESGSPVVAKEIIRHGIVHMYVQLMSFEQDDLTERVIKALYFVYSKYSANFVFISQDEEYIFYEISQSNSDEIAEYSKLFIKKFIRNRRKPF